MRVLFTTPVLEHPAAGGPQLRIENSIKALAEECELDIISRSPPVMTGGTNAETFYRGLCREYHLAPGYDQLSGNRYLRKLQRIFGGLGGRDIAREADFILAHVDRRQSEVIWFGYGNISFPLMQEIKRRRPGLKIVCDTDSVWSRFVLRELPYARGMRKLWIAHNGKAKEQEERAWVNLCEVTTAVSAVDAEYYRSIAADPARVKVFSNVIDVRSYQTKPAAPATFHHPSIYLAGTFGHYHSPMDTAARWVIEEVLPILRRDVPDVHFYIVGNHSDRMFGHLQDPHITVTGKLPSVLPYLCHVDVALVPLKFESGTRFKILEAGACQVPLVSTTLGAEGIPVQDGQHLLLADEPAAFAAAILRLLRDRAFAQRLAMQCGELVQAHYSVESLRGEARGILEFLQRGR